jgi:hypothetical protein
MESSNFIAKASCRPVLMPRIVLTILLFIETAPVGRKGAFESPSLIRKRNQTNQLQTKLLTSGPGGRRFKSSPRPILKHLSELTVGAIGRNSGTVKPNPTPLCRHCAQHPVYLYPGASVPYHFVGDDDDKFRLDFSYKGPVRVKGTVDYDAEGTPALVSVAEVERLQTELPLPEPEHR